MKEAAGHDWERDRAEFDRLLEALRAESDRGALLMCLGYLDERLSKLVRSAFSCFPGRERASRTLVAFPGPLSTLSSRLALSYCMGLIGDGEYSAINALRKIRNEAAHGFEPFAFGDKPTADRLASIGPVLRGEAPPLAWVRDCQARGLLARDPLRDWRFVFTAAVSHVGGALRAAIQSMERDGVTIHQIHPSSRIAAFVDSVVAERVAEALNQ